MIFPDETTPYPDEIDDSIKYDYKRRLNPRVTDSITAYVTTGTQTDPLGMYTGYPNMTTKPELDEEGNLRVTIEDAYSAAEMPVQDVENQQYLKRRLEDSDDPDEPVQDADDL